MKVSKRIKSPNPMDRTAGNAVSYPELRVARNLLADVSAKKILQTIVSCLTALFLMVCANLILGLVGRLGFVDLSAALLIVSPFYLGSLGRLWSAFGVSFW